MNVSTHGMTYEDLATMNKLRAAFLVAAMMTASGYASAESPRLRISLLTDWGPFRLEVSTAGRTPARIDPQRLAIQFADENGARATGSPKLEVIGLQGPSGQSPAALIDYAVTAPPSGLFRYALHAQPGLFDSTGPAPEIDVEGLDPLSRSPFGHMYLPPAPARRTGLQTGARFADIDGVYGAPMDVFTVLSRRRSGGTIHVTLRSDDGKRLSLRASSDSPFGLPELLPLENDSNIVQLRRRFRRGRAWSLGKIGMYCGGRADSNDRNQPELRVLDDRSIGIKRIMRVHGFIVSIAPGSPGLWRAEEAPHFFAVDPVIIVYSRRWPGCASSFWVLADTWQVERFFSPMSLDEAHPNWSASVRTALKLERVRPGMTHEMVAWARGYPIQYGTAAALNKAPRWDYDLMIKYAQWAIFKGDRLIEYHGTGGWPP